MLKKAGQQDRGERRGEEVQTALRVGRSPLQWVLANGKAPTAFPISENLLLSVELLSEARTPLADFFSILLIMWYRQRIRTVSASESVTLRGASP